MNLQVYLISRPNFDAEEFFCFLKKKRTGWVRSRRAKPAEELVEAAGRICYFSFGENQICKSNEEYIRRLIESEHESVLEHVNWTFVVTGVSRSLTHQLVRHRVGFSFSQLSQQFHDESDAEFVEPPELRDFPQAQDIWKNAVDSAREAYRRLKNAINKRSSESGKAKISDKAVRTIARSVLPNATESKIVITANARALRHFLRIRGTVLCDVEMRRLAACILQTLKVEAPALFFDFSIEELGDGSLAVAHKTNP